MRQFLGGLAAQVRPLLQFIEIVTALRLEDQLELQSQFVIQPYALLLVTLQHGEDDGQIGLLLELPMASGGQPHPRRRAPHALRIRPMLEAPAHPVQQTPKDDHRAQRHDLIGDAQFQCGLLVNVNVDRTFNTLGRFVEHELTTCRRRRRLCWPSHLDTPNAERRVAEVAHGPTSPIHLHHLQPGPIHIDLIARPFAVLVANCV
mmetsp:Transcript_30253/g.87212  ORF Transcript_30253/g.87212 Transcript_30253/m.87212 type:complete len:204 (-) Transcript_30253:2427-3038(-)